MKPYRLLSFLLAAAVLSCGKADIPEPKPAILQESGTGAATGIVSVSLGGPFATTRVADPSSSVENTCHRWAVWFFDQNGDSVAYGTGQAGDSIRRTVLAGRYTIVAVANYPDRLIPEQIKRMTQITQWVSNLSDNSTGSMLMYGESSLELEKDQTVSRNVDVRRLVAKVGVKKVSVAFENPYLAAKTTRLEAIYLTNLYRTSRLGTDFTDMELSASESAWYNVMGWRPDNAANPQADALVGDLDIRVTLTPSAPHNTPHYFYAYPNAMSMDDDTHEASWSKRSTRLVLQVAIGNKTYYYQVQVPSMGRNRIYVADEIILKKLGSMDPEQEIPGSVDVVFSALGVDWDQDVNVSENS